MAENRSKTPEPWLDPHAQAYIRIENVTKRFGTFVAVNNVSLSVFKGEIFCLLGGSGCGKTTLLRMLAGFEQPTSGAVYIDGQGSGRFAHRNVTATGCPGRSRAAFSGEGRASTRYTSLARVSLL